MIDVHSHILYGIDDGSKSIEESIDIINGLKSQGFTDLILTPHYVAETIYTSEKNKNKKILEKIKKEVKDINIYLGNEIYVDRFISDLLKTGKISSLAGSKYLLIELPMSGEFDGFEDIFDSLRHEGYKVILAHPERYSATHHDFSILERLQDSGVLFQCNYGSFIGQYGKNSKKTVEYLARNKMIFTLGTDIHHPRDYSEIAKSLKRLQKFYSKDEIENLTCKNPHKILAK